MRLYLSSYRLGVGRSHLLSLMGSRGKVAIIENALDYLPIEVRQKYKEDVYDPKKEFLSLGITAENIDLRKYFGKSEDLLNTLQNFDLVWVLGGNVFLLRRVMKQSGFDQIIIDLLKQDKIAYGGFSAGSVIAAPTLKGIDIIDDPAIVTEGYDSEIIWEGLKLIDFSIVPHYQSNHPESKLADSVAAFFKINGYPFKTMRDGDVLIMNGTELELLSVD